VAGRRHVSQQLLERLDASRRAEPVSPAHDLLVVVDDDGPSNVAERAEGRPVDPVGLREGVSRFLESGVLDGRPAVERHTWHRIADVAALAGELVNDADDASGIAVAEQLEQASCRRTRAEQAAQRAADAVHRMCSALIASHERLLDDRRVDGSSSVICAGDGGSPSLGIRSPALVAAGLEHGLDVARAIVGLAGLGRDGRRAGRKPGNAARPRVIAGIVAPTARPGPTGRPGLTTA
jgi:hypothetical protein